MLEQANWQVQATDSDRFLLSVEKNEEEVILIKLKVAECYWLLNKKDDSLALYNQLTALDDPFWSSLAKERLDDMTFKTEMETTKRD